MPDPQVKFLADVVDPDGHQWTVRETEHPIDSCVNLVTHEADIPRARTRASEQIRFHELAHVAFSGNPLHHETEMMSRICKMLDEFRVDWVLKTRSGIDVSNRHDDFDMVELATKIHPSPFPRAMMYLQLRFQAAGVTTATEVKDLFRQMQDALAPDLVTLLEHAIKDICDFPDLEHREKWAKRIFDYFAPPPPPATPKAETKEEVRELVRQQIAQEAEEQARKEKVAARPRTPSKPTPQKELTREEQKKQDKEDKKLYAPGHGGMPRFGHAEIHDHLTRNQKFEQVKAPFTRSGRGIVPEFMEQWCVDKRVYRTDHRGGVLVIDTSGSMRPNWSLIQDQMASFPNLVVMSYGGVSRARASGRTEDNINGRICVHSRAGRIDPIFRNEPGRTGANNVDVEALEYGAKFKGPRIWVSDGWACGGAYDVDGRYDQYETGKLPIKIRAIMKQHHYVRVKDLEDALAYVNQSRQVHYWTAGILEVDSDPTSTMPSYEVKSYAQNSVHHKYGRRIR